MKLTILTALKLLPVHIWEATHIEWIATALRLANVILPLRKPMADCVMASLSEMLVDRGCNRRVIEDRIFDGKFRLGMLDAEIYYRAYVEGKTEFFTSLAHLGGSTEALDTPNRVINHMFRMGGHYFFVWDFETLKNELERAGFTGVEKSKSGSASIPELCLDDPAHEFETLYIEATK